LKYGEVVAPGQKISIFPGKFPKNFDFSGNLKKNRLFQENFQKISNFSGKNWSFTAICLLLGRLFYLSSKVTTFEHTSCSIHDKI